MKTKAKTAPKAALEKKGTTAEKKDMGIDKKQGIKENSKTDMLKDSQLQKLMAARGMK